MRVSSLLLSVIFATNCSDGEGNINPADGGYVPDTSMGAGGSTLTGGSDAGSGFGGAVGGSTLSGGSRAGGGVGGTAGGSAAGGGSRGTSGGSAGGTPGVDSRGTGEGGATSSPDAAPVVYGNPLEGNPKPKKVEGQDGFDSEGPFWVTSGSYLLFSDVTNAKIWKMDPAQPAAKRFTQFTYRPGTKTNGLALDGSGNLLVCERETGKVGRIKLGGGVPDALVTGYGGKSFNAPNDIVVRADGNVYFSDPTWGSGTGTPLPLSAYRIAPSGAVSLVTTGTVRPQSPNGIALSPDGNTLYVGDDAGGTVWKYDVAADGATSGGAKFVSNIQTPDGIAIDDAGNLYVASNSAAKAIKVYAKTGAPIGDILYPAQPSNASFGGADRKTLYATVATAIYEVSLAVPGLP